MRIVFLGLAIVALASRSPAAPARVGAPRSSSSPATRIEYEGTLLYEGHFRRPGDVRVFHSRQSYFTDGGDRARLDWTTWQEGVATLGPETYLLVGDRVFHRDAPERSWREFGGDRARQMRALACAGLPLPLQRVARALGDPLVETRIVAGRLERYTRLQAHPRLGDVYDSVAYVYRGANPLPDSMSMAFYLRSDNWRLAQHRVAWSDQTMADSLFALPASFDPPSPEEQDTLSGAPALVEIAPGVWSADMEDIDSRTLIVEFADHLAVIEAADGSANGERIADAARGRWPDKPIRYVLFSHYHPHFAGGLRALIAEGATVITTPGNEAFVRRVAALPFRTKPDRLARDPRPLGVVTFGDRYVLSDSTNRLVAINYGEFSQHTNEFVVFWLPRQKLLFEAELGWTRVNGTTRASSRAKTLLAWLGEQGLNVDRFVQSWPMRDNEAVVTWARLDSLVEGR
jgi:glyoxylase-like metal-dependent hydrolase (beta-lactamase superfamily II)